MAYLHVIASQKGGAGKTTTAVNLAAAVADVLNPGSREASPVYLVTTDPQGSAIWWCNRVDSADQEAADRKGGPKRKPMPFDFHPEVLKPGQLPKLKQTDRYRHIFVDTPGTLDPEQGDDARFDILDETLTYADDVVVPMEAAPLAYEPTTRTVETMLMPRGIPFTVVVNKVDNAKAAEGGRETLEYVDARGWPRSQVVIRYYKLHLNASLKRELCTQYPPNQASYNAREDFYRLAIDLGYGGGGAFNGKAKAGGA